VTKIVLILEDDALIALDLEDRVRSMGFEVIGSKAKHRTPPSSTATSTGSHP
jgi:hypothetical protein